MMMMMITMIVRFAVNDFTLDPAKIRDNRVHITNFDVNKVTMRCAVLKLTKDDLYILTTAEVRQVRGQHV